MSDNQGPYNTPNKTPSSPSDKRWGMTLHMSALIGLLLPLGLVLGPLLVWMLKKNDSDYFDKQGKNAVNFQLTILLAAFVFALLGSVIRPLFALAFVAGITGILFAIIAGFSVNRNGKFNYPFSFPFIK